MAVDGDSDIAVVVTCSNQGRTIEAALASLQTQTRSADRIVLVDNDSDDIHTRQVLARVRQPRLSLEHSQPRGLPEALNRGAKKSTSRYLGFLDGGDRWEPAFLQRAAAILDARPEIALVLCSPVEDGQISPARPAGFTFAEVLARGLGMVPCLMRRSLFESLGGFDSGLGDLATDHFWLSAIEQGFSAETIAQPLARRHPLSSVPCKRDRATRQWCEDRQRLLSRHETMAQKQAREILAVSERLVHEEKQRRQALGQEMHTLEATLTQLGAQVQTLEVSLRNSGVQPVDWGDLARVAPFSPLWGAERGEHIDRYYIERFLDRHRSDVRGRVLEVCDDTYTRRFGQGRVLDSDVLDIEQDNPQATIIADLARAHNIPAESYDCFILTQTLYMIYEVADALAHSFRILKPGGVLLCTLPATCRITFEHGGLDSGDFWRFTEASVRRLFAAIVPAQSFEVTVCGNVMVCAAFLQGLALHELPADVLDQTDPWHPLLYCVRAAKPGSAALDGP